MNDKKILKLAKLLKEINECGNYKKITKEKDIIEVMVKSQKSSRSFFLIGGIVSIFSVFLLIALPLAIIMFVISLIEFMNYRYFSIKLALLDNSRRHEKNG